MEDAAGVVRRIILLWCEVIILPCPPSLSSSLVYFWLAAVCTCVCVCADALSFLCTLTANSYNRKHREKHLASLLFVVVKAPKLGQRQDTVCICVVEDGRVRSVVFFLQYSWLGYACLNSSTFSFKSSSPHSPSPSPIADMTQNKATDFIPSYRQRSNATAK